MTKAKKVKRTPYSPHDYKGNENASALDKLNQAKSDDVDYSKDFKQIGFLGHLGSINKHKNHTLSVVPKSQDEGESDNLPLMALGLAAIVLAVAVVVVTFMGLPEGILNFKP